MGNEQLHNNDHLFQAAKQHLQNRHEPNDGMNWDRMSRDLDKLPRGKRLKWSFSLNSILALVGVAGLALGGYALLGGHSTVDTKSGLPAAPAVVTAPQPKAPAATTNAPAPVVNIPNTVTTAPAEPATTAPASAVASNTAGTTGQQADKRTKKDRTGNHKTGSDANSTPELATSGTGSEKNFSDLLFGDQIDPKHGPVFETQENTDKLGNVPPVDPKSLTYFDGAGKPIHIKGDTSKGFTTENGAAPKKKQRRNKKSDPEPARDLPPADNGTGN